MYLPPAFAQDHIDVLRATMRNAGLATLVTVASDGLIASHVPMLLDPDPAPYGTLLGHLARGNQQAAGATGDALAIFQGPDAYVTPSWYPTKRTSGKVVPTWNYVAIHASGPITFFDDRQRLLDIVTRLTEREESKRAAPWAVSDAPADFVAGMLRAIVGFALPIARLQGKWKLSQNRPADDQAGVAAGLEADGRPEVAALVAAVARKPGA